VLPRFQVLEELRNQFEGILGRHFERADHPLLRLSADRKERRADQGGRALQAAQQRQVRTVALPSMAGEELRADWLRQAEALLKLRIRLSDDTLVAVQADGSFTSREF
jgi:hypothetical protein